ncbi:hypothetical protein I6N90_06840 [Paenibacillus sp. GSMTC-2017]|uniref:hypothetical protein n=1 Tax=Paenibacillus sp. GSMTC-2017 TaxID=2794350 RepID=UPI0018D91B83|nr:hypothetical protein [Paenibacillus sp. GSMTC-2017]MBH5317532.1 hypothetical protein [Paenibacillus sp. GSMTC-2017]
MKRYLFIIYITLGTIMVTSCGDRNQSDLIVEHTSPPAVVANPELSKEEEILLRYLKEEQYGQFGTYTNRLDSDQRNLVTTGHEVLSESAGLMMKYYAAKKNREAFEREWETAKQVFDQETSLSYRYSPKLNKRYPVNAAVDDLRIIRALYDSTEIFEDSRYVDEANKYASTFVDHTIVDDKLYDFYDEKYKTVNAFITLCYIDLATLSKLPLTEHSSMQLQTNMLDIIEAGYLSDKFPFYETRYYYADNRFETAEINMVEAMLTVLHLAEVGNHKEASLLYIKEHVKNGTLFGRYSKEGKPATDIRSTALYAIAAMIGHQVDDEELYKDSISEMKKFQIGDQSSPLYGGFGDPNTGQAYSFDNLMALYALALRQH